MERFAESVTVLADDEESVSLLADLLPPVAPRLGLLLLCCGPEAFVMTPADLDIAGATTARQLLRPPRADAELVGFFAAGPLRLRDHLRPSADG